MGFAYVATLDCADPERLAPFWADALHYRPNPYHAPYLTLTDPLGKSQELILQKVPEPKRRKHRMHLDLFLGAYRGRSAADGSAFRPPAGGRALTGPTGDRWIVMADPDGNEFCVCEGDITTLEAR